LHLQCAYDLVLMAKEGTVLQGIIIRRLIEIGRKHRMEMKVEKLK